MKKTLTINSLEGGTIDNAISIIRNDVDDKGIVKFYWLEINSSIENIMHFVRFPRGRGLYIEYNDAGTVTKAYYD